jgi:hypothetical protein
MTWGACAALVRFVAPEAQPAVPCEAVPESPASSQFKTYRSQELSTCVDVAEMGRHSSKLVCHERAYLPQLVACELQMLQELQVCASLLLDRLR